MQNPMLAVLNGTASRQKQTNNIFSTLAAVKSFLTGKNPDVVFNQMLQSNPQFAQFVNENKDKSPEQIAKENGLDINMIKTLIS